MQKLYITIISTLLTIASINFSSQAVAEILPDVSAGKKRAAVCFACHGTNGISKLGDTPHLAGQNRVYLQKSLHLYREGQKRQDPTMNAMAKPLSDTDIVNISTYFSIQSRMDNGQTCGQELEAIARIRPIGRVNTSATQQVASMTTEKTQDAAPTKPKSRSGEEVYTAACASCHKTGIMSAPKLGDKAAWTTRLEQGLPTLIEHANKGFKVMPAKGGCASCTDAEIEAAVKYLIGHSNESK